MTATDKMASPRKRRGTESPSVTANKRVIQIPTIPPRKYNLTRLNDFLDVVFGAVDLGDKEEILTWKVSPGKTPNRPMTDITLLDHLKEHHAPKALYFGTATTRRNPLGELRNKQDLFSRLVLVVLDDIGTKVPADAIKATPTYILETSPNNFQYGYVLSEAVTNLAAATGLVQVIYNAGLSDGGGKMPTKIVRLPEGIHGKAGPTQGFVTRIVSLDGPYWSPQDLLTTLGLGICWADMLADAEEVLRNQSAKHVGATPWSQTTPTALSLSGLIDPVLEWMYDMGMVAHDNGEWVSIECPWAATHTTGDNIASYSPIGRGRLPDNRGFHCFHGHCNTNSIAEFLSYISASGGPVAGSWDPVAKLNHEWIYDALSDSAWSVATPNAAENVTISAFRNLFPHTVSVIKADGKELKAKQAQLWLTSPSRATVYGQTFDPSTTLRIIKVAGKDRVNTFQPTSWPLITPDPHHVSKFTNFLAYLIPAERERNYFIDWLSAKATDLGFRGCGILMIAQTHGIGRTTLGDMLAALFGRQNTESIPFDKMIGENQFNDWMERPLVITDETANRGDTDRFSAYERLKEIIDPRPKTIRINPKYGKQRVSKTHSSYLMLSNHENALHIPPADRRIYVIRNALLAETPRYFTDLAAWLDEVDENGAPVWAAHIWNWLRERNYDLERLLAPAPSTEGKINMLIGNESVLDQLVRLCIEGCDSEYIASAVVLGVAEELANQIDLFDIPKWKTSIPVKVRSKTLGYGNVTVNCNGKVRRPRLIAARKQPDSVLPSDSITPAQRKRIGTRMAENEVARLAHYVTSRIIVD